jgi:hypothetical protein
MACKGAEHTARGYGQAESFLRPRARRLLRTRRPPTVAILARKP